MSLPLPVSGERASPEAAWAEFLARRAALTARMSLSICNGCDSCGGRCIEGFTVTRAEYDAARQFLAEQPAAEVQRVLSQEKSAPWPGDEDGFASVTFCRFRDRENGNCFIYPVRPTVCRLFGHTSWLPCPIDAIPTRPSGDIELWTQYRAFEHRTWAGWEAEDAGPA